MALDYDNLFKQNIQGAQGGQDMGTEETTLSDKMKKYKQKRLQTDLKRVYKDDNKSLMTSVLGSNPQEV